MIVGLIGYDSIRKHLAACGYYTAEIREKYYLRIADAYIDIKEQRGQYWLENIMKDRFAVSMFGQKRLSREGGIEIVVKELCTRMARDGCQVTCYNRSGHHVSGAEYDNKIEYDGIRQKFVPTIERKGLAAVSSSFFAALYSAFGKYDVVHIHAEGPAFFSWLPKMFRKRVVVTIHGIDWQREKWKSGFGSKFIRQGEKNAVKYADEIIVLSKGVQDYFTEYTIDKVNLTNAYCKYVKKFISCASVCELIFLLLILLAVSCNNFTAAIICCILFVLVIIIQIIVFKKEFMRLKKIGDVL